MATRNYFTLCTLEQIGGSLIWAPQFGDYDRETVAQERKDSYSFLGSKAWRIVKTATARQSDVTAAIAKLNGESI